MEILWWHWLVIGVVLAVAELATPGGFYVIFFGIGATAVGLLASVGMAGPLWVQILLFLAISVVSLLLFRNRLLRSLQPDPQAPTIDTLVGEVGIAAGEIAAGGIGQVELRGTAWSARNNAEVVVSRGARCKVVRVEGLTLHIVPEGVR
jgi:membrane protein implicated in regulation of membrane protease activity